MADRNWFDQFGDFAKKANDATFGAALRGAGLLGKAVSQVPTRIVEAVNPIDEESKGDEVLNTAAQRYGFTPLLRDRLYNSNPVLTNTPIDTHGTLSGNTKADGARFGDDRLHRVSINESTKDPLGVIRHEGLHDIYATFPDSQKSQFRDLVKRGFNDLPNEYTPPDQEGNMKVTRTGLSNYLQGRLRGYSDMPQDITNLDAIDPDIHDEIHSYIPDYFDQQKVNMPDYLRNYYANFYNTGGQPTGIQQQGVLRELIGKLWPNG